MGSHGKYCQYDEIIIIANTQPQKWQANYLMILYLTQWNVSIKYQLNFIPQPYFSLCISLTSRIRQFVNSQTCFTSIWSTIIGFYSNCSHWICLICSQRGNEQNFISNVYHVMFLRKIIKNKKNRPFIGGLWKPGVCLLFHKKVFKSIDTKETKTKTF